MAKRMLFIDRRGVRIDDQLIEIRGRTFPVGAISEVRIVEEPQDPLTIRAVRASAGISLCAMIVATAAEPLAMRLSALGVVAVALAVAFCVTRLRPTRVSVRALHAERSELLFTTEDSTFANQVGRAVIRAREWNHRRIPTVYRVIGSRAAISLPMALNAALAVGTAYLVVQR